MAGVFRFSNAVSDIDKIVDTYKMISTHFYEMSEAGQYFNHSQAAEFLAMNGLASSLGAIGATALSRSTREDKSRDPLYNQHKSYSEMFRMLGWYEPGSMQTNFKLSEYGSYIAETTDNAVIKKKVYINDLHIVSTNPLTNVKGGNTLRPFPMILKLMLKLDGIITRDEIIAGVLCCQDDKVENIVNNTADMLKQCRRGGVKAIENEIMRIRQEHNLGSPATLQNYTRFPIAVMKWAGWAEGINKRGVYGNNSIKILQLTEKGKDLARSIMDIPDVRYESIEYYPNKVLGAFVALSNLTKLAHAGFEIGEYVNLLPSLRQLCSPILTEYGINDDRYLFFGYQEVPRELLVIADEVLESIE